MDGPDFQGQRLETTDTLSVNLEEASSQAFYNCKKINSANNPESLEKGPQPQTMSQTWLDRRLVELCGWNLVKLGLDP